jgi:hypothetical protein
MKKHYFLAVDVETANSTDDALVYDFGYAVCDREGNIYESGSLIVAEIFYGEADLMTSAYYAEKIPQYLEGITSKSHKVVSFYQVRRIVADIMERYNIEAVCAYNAHFDTSALNTTERYLTSSRYRYFFPYGTQVYCIWHMACQVLCTQKRYRKFCEANELVSPSGNLKTSAETVYAYMTKNAEFDEAHTGLEDVKIEVEILAKCFAQHKKMNKNINRACWRIPQKRG